MNYIVVGSGRLGATLAYQLFLNQHKVTVIDLDGAAFANLPPNFRGRTIEGEVLNQGMLARAGIVQAQGVAAVTSSDTLNAVICHLASRVYQVPHVVARNYDPRWLPIFEAFGVQMVSSPLWAAERMEALLTTPHLRSVWAAGNGEVGLYEMIVPAAWAGRKLAEALAKDARPVAVTRAGTAMPPTDDLVLKAGDILHVSGTPATSEALRTELQQLQEA